MFGVGLLVLWGCFEFSLIISKLTLRNRELAMQVSLLNQENDRILTELENMTGKSRQEI